MKVWLVNPGEKEFLENAGDRPPLGLMYLSSALKSNGVSTIIKDLNKTSYQGFLNDFRIDAPDIVGISCLSPVYNKVKDLSDDLRMINKNVKIVVGGFHATHQPEDFKNIADQVVMGYGEDELVSIVTGKSFNKFDINRYPVPDRSLAIPKNYSLTINNKPATIMNTSRGCPFTCSFCGNFDRKSSFRNYESIDEECEIIFNQGFREVYVVDDSFGINTKHAIDVCCTLDNNGLGYRVCSRASLISDGLVEILKLTGCDMVSMGIESGNDKILSKNNKGTNTKMVYDAVKRLGDAEIKVKGFFILGLPYDTISTIKDTIRFSTELKRVGLTSADFYVLCPFPGTPIYENPEKFNCKIIDNDFTKYLQAGKTTPECYVDNGFINPKLIPSLVCMAKETFERY